MVIGDFRRISIDIEDDRVQGDRCDAALAQDAYHLFPLRSLDQLTIAVWPALESFPAIAQRDPVPPGVTQSHGCMDSGIPAAHNQNILVLVLGSIVQLVADFGELFAWNAKPGA